VINWQTQLYRQTGLYLIFRLD